MKKYLLCCLLSFAAQSAVTAQTIENTVNLYGLNFPREKIHMHFDKEFYLPGETIWFKAYLFEENMPSGRSTNFYAALYDENGTLLQKQISPIFGASTDGHFDVPDSLASKQLICRAYTNWMLNFDTSFLFTKAITLINKNAKDGNINAASTVSLQFFPEGGDIIEGTRNTIAFKANYSNGLPFNVTGVIKKQQTGEVIMPLRSAHDGMGRFDLEILPNEKFYAEWTDDKNNIQQTYLPNANAVGVSLKLVQQKDKLIFNIVNKLPSDSLHVLMYMYQKVFYKKNLSVPADVPFTSIVPTGSLPTGVMQVTVFNANWQPVAERVAFINNNNFTLPAALNNKEIKIQKREKNTIEIAVTDTIAANFSLSITDAEFNNEASSNTIITNLLLGGEIKGYLHNPAWYFSAGSNDSLKTNLDLVMLTQGWRRYNWGDMLSGKIPVVTHPADEYLTAYGQVGKEALENMEKGEQVNLVVRKKDSTRNFYFLHPDRSGLLKQPGLVFYDTARIYYSFNKNKLWNNQLTFSTSNLTANQPNSISNYSSFLSPRAQEFSLSQTANLYIYYNSNKAGLVNRQGKTLQEVVVTSGRRRSWKYDPLSKMDERYTSGFFRGNVFSNAFDVMHDPKAETKADIYNYVSSQGGDFSFGVANSDGVKSFAGNPLIFVNEVLVENDALEFISLDDIAYIKTYTVYRGQISETQKTKPTQTGYGPAICIYLKKGDDLLDRRPKGTDLRFVKIAGYTPLKEFYSPDYTEQKNMLGTDARTTLLWLPYILTDKNNLKIPVSFFNNDISKKLKLVLEGINDEGKMVHIEKIIE